MSFNDDFGHLKIQLKDIKLATNDFGDKPIGIGGFGKVFKGELSFPVGKKMVAFKRLDRRHGQGDTEFWKEIMMLSQYKHENLISLLHFCDEDGERILVYEYASHGSLDCYLGKTSLTWNQLLKICHGAACGLNYLHDPKNSLQRVLHRDVKSSNILVDENLTAKISDFGLSKMGPANQQYTYLVSNVVGTPGYCDPVYMETGSLSKESDVYSFGVVLFEVMCGRHCFECCNGELKILVPMWKKYYEEDKIDDLVPNHLKGEMDMDSCKTFLNIAYRCLHRDCKERPTMAEIIKELEIAQDHQEMSQDVDERARYEERINIANEADPPISYRSRNDLAVILSKGIRLKGGYRKVSINKNGENQEMLFINQSKPEEPDDIKCYGVICWPRGPPHINGLYSLCCDLRLQGTARFLSTRVTYSVNLVYKTYSSHRCEPFKYKLHTETKYWTSYVAQERSDRLSSTKLYQFTSSQREHDFQLEFLGQLRPVYRHCRPVAVHRDIRGLIKLIGIEFLPEEYEKDEKLEKEKKVAMEPITDLDSSDCWEKILASDYDEIFKWSKSNMQWTTNKERYHLLRNGILVNKNFELWFSVSKHMKKRLMLPATSVLKARPILTSLFRKKPWIWKSQAESRFKLVAEFCEIENFTIACKIDTLLLSPGTTYACYLVFKLPEKHMDTGLVQIDDGTLSFYDYYFHSEWTLPEKRLVDLSTPTHIPFIGCNADETHIPSRKHRVKGHPKLRKDGWTEIQIWEYHLPEEFRCQNIQKCIRVRRCHKWKCTGLLVQGIEFRPAKFSLLYCRE